jgi:hypothetical protein
MTDGGCGMKSAYELDQSISTHKIDEENNTSVVEQEMKISRVLAAKH